MDKMMFCKKVQQMLFSVRKSKNMTLEEMAYTIGLSKKSLIQIEKERNNLKWAEAVTFVSIFSEHEEVKSVFGDEVIDIIQSISNQKNPNRQLKTMGGEAWWNNVRNEKGFTLQQHKISRHYRILDEENYRLYFSYSKKDSVDEFMKYCGEYYE